MILKKNRIAWQNAYIAADTEKLQYMETEDFSVTVGGKTILRKERFQRMRGANFSDRWSSRSTRFVDYDLMLERRSGSLVVINANSAVFEGDKLIGRIQAVEIWVLVDGNWKVQSLAYDSLPENEW